jgi:glycosyltransferase involved in cell wall biosynthesis
VIIIFLNGERYIAEAIESVLAQTFTDFELVLVDDGTTDGATAIAKDYAARWPGKIFYTEHPGHENRGMSASRNRGIAMARGEYVAFLDADDVYLPERVATHVAILEANPGVAMVAGPTLWWRSWVYPEGSPKGRWMDRASAQNLPHHRLLPPPDVALWFLETRGAYMFGICSITVRRAAALEAGGFEDRFRTLYEDQVFLFRMCLRFPIWVIGDVLDRYRQHDESACNAEGRRDSDLRMRPIFLGWLQEHLVDSGVKDERIWRALRREQLRFDQPRLWWWATLPRRVKDAWNYNSRRLLIMALTPAGYVRLRAWLGLPHVDPASVG